MSNTSLKKIVAKSRHPATARPKKRGDFNYNKLTAVIVMAISSLVSILVIRWIFLFFA